jgi:hypothetical protein
MRYSPKGPNEQAGMVARRTRVLFYGALGGGTGNGAADGLAAFWRACSACFSA